ncbi:MAG: methyl-accepting chemotaxis protein [Phycisphaeraceae bacterium JB051]
MKIRTKLIILVIMPLTALFVQGGIEWLNSFKQMQKAVLLTQTSQIATHISNLVHELQIERGRTAGYLASQGKQFQNELNNQKLRTDEKLATLDQALEAYPLQKTTKHVQERLQLAVEHVHGIAAVRNQIQTLNIDTPKALAFYTNLNEQMLAVVESMEELSTSPMITTHWAANVYLQKTKEKSGIERALLSNAFTIDAFTPVIYEKFIGNLAQQKAYMNEFNTLCTDQMKQIYQVAASDPAFDKVDNYRDLAMKKAKDGQFGVKAADWFDTISIKIQKLKEAEDKITQIIGQEIDQSYNAASKHLLMIKSLCLGFGILTMLIGIWSYRSINGPIQAMTHQMQDIAQGQGDLTQRVKISRRDELGVMAGYFNLFVEKIQSTVRHVAESTADVAAAATEIAATSEQMAVNLQQQKTQNAQVASAVEELSASVMEIASRTTHLSDHANSSGQTAMQGNQVVENTVVHIKQISEIVNQASAQIQELGERSKSISVVINVINDIAEQTNLLALNAAIEAARAGQHGRGFAVVADEVRKLAERTTSATDEVTQLITAIQKQTLTTIEHMDKGTGLVSDGVSAAQSAGKALNNIVNDTQEVDTLVGTIAAATEQQSSATQEISRSIESINAASNQSNEAAHQAAAAAEQLSKRAETLQNMVNQFKV